LNLSSERPVSSLCFFKRNVHRYGVVLFQQKSGGGGGGGGGGGRGNPIENRGVVPDIEVVVSPTDHALGKDPQLDAAVGLCTLESS
jgi:hypothetical protein